MPDDTVLEGQPERVRDLDGSGGSRPNASSSCDRDSPGDAPIPKLSIVVHKS